jgi:predicted dehydrogenase
MPQPHPSSRRIFLKTTVAAGVSSAYLSSYIATAAPTGKKVRHAGVGVGGKGLSDLCEIASHAQVEVTALCDVDKKALGRAGKKFPKAKRYTDWREMFDKEADNIDSVHISTPDHMHAPVTMRAMMLGKHVYTQKPFTHDVYEARQLKNVAIEKKLVTQMGTQFASGVADRLTEKLVAEGAIGKVKEIFCWSNKRVGKYRPKGPRPKKSHTPPTTFDWDKWIGIAPVRPYVKGVYHPDWWRGWQDFGCGWLGDMGCHILSAPFRILNMVAPISIKAEVEPEWVKDAARFREVFPQWEIIEYIFPGSKITANDTIKVTWSDGGKYPDDKYKALIGNKPFPPQGMLAIGTKGAILLPHGSGSPKLYPKTKIKRVTFKHTNHYHQYIDGILKNDPDFPRARFSFASQLSEAISLGVIALRFPDKLLQWDSKAMKFTNLPAANKFLKRAYRKGWEEKGL